MRFAAADSNTTSLPSRLTTGRRLPPSGCAPSYPLVPTMVLPVGPQSPRVAGGRVVGVVPGSVVVGVPPVGFDPPEPGPLGWGGSGAVLWGAAAMPTMARLSRRLPAEP